MARLAPARQAPGSRSRCPPWVPNSLWRDPRCQPATGSTRSTASRSLPDDPMSCYFASSLFPVVVSAASPRPRAQGGHEEGMGLVRLFQVSDFHLGCPFGWLSAEQRDRRRRDQRRALERSVQEAIERGAHAILLPGDLFDRVGVDADTLGFVLETLQVSGCPPVFIAPGNHDPYFPRSLCWNDALLAARGRQWPAHVHVFTSDSWTSAEVPELERVRIWGRCFVSPAVSTERPLDASATRSITPGDGSRVELALFHGSREGTCPYGMDLTAPFSDAEALASPFTYLAVGHYHAQALLSAQQGPAAGVRLAYAGSPVALNMSEVGLHGALDVRIEFGRRQPYIEAEPVRLDPRQVHAVPVDVTRCGSAEQVDR